MYGRPCFLAVEFSPRKKKHGQNTKIKILRFVHGDFRGAKEDGTYVLVFGVGVNIIRICYILNTTGSSGTSGSSLIPVLGNRLIWFALTWPVYISLLF